MPQGTCTTMTEPGVAREKQARACQDLAQERWKTLSPRYPPSKKRKKRVAGDGCFHRCTLESNGHRGKVPSSFRAALQGRLGAEAKVKRRVMIIRR